MCGTMLSKSHVEQCLDGDAKQCKIKLIKTSQTVCVSTIRTWTVCQSVSVCLSVGRIRAYSDSQTHKFMYAQRVSWRTLSLFHTHTLSHTYRHTHTHAHTHTHTHTHTCTHTHTHTHTYTHTCARIHRRCIHTYTHASFSTRVSAQLGSVCMKRYKLIHIFTYLQKDVHLHTFILTCTKLFLTTFTCTFSKTVNNKDQNQVRPYVKN